MENEIRELREMTGMNRREFCDYFGIPYRTVQDWEAGKRNIPDYLFRLMQYKINIEKGLKKQQEGKKRMRLKDGFVTHDADGEQIMVAAGNAKFAGLVRSNKTAAYIVDLLKTNTTKTDIIDAMAAKYDAPRERIAEDVENILVSLRSIGAIDEQ